MNTKLLSLFGVFLFLGLFTALGLRASGSVQAPETERVSNPMPMPAADPKAGASGLLIDLGNANCPIMGGAADGKTYGEWNHLRVGYCCPGCDGRFQDDPEAALQKAGIEWREAAEAVAAYLAAPQEHKQHKLAAIARRWTIVREPEGS